MKYTMNVSKTHCQKRLIITGLLTLCLIFQVSLSEAQSAKKAFKSGKAFLKVSLYDSAIKCFNEVISLEADNSEAYVLRAQAFEQTKKMTEAANDYMKASELSPKDEQIAYDAGRLLFALGKHMEAIFKLNRAIELNQSFLNPYLIKIQSLMALNNPKEALVVCDQAIEVEQNAQNYYNHGVVSEKLNNDLAAEADYRKAIKEDKDFKWSYIGLANVLARQNKTDEALKYCNWVLALYSDYTDAYITRSGIYYRKSDLINAIADITKAIEYNPLIDSFYFIRARYNYEFKQYENAINDYSKSISWNSNNHMAFYNRAIIYEELKKSNEASVDYATFLKLADIKPELADKLTKAKQKIYELNTESIKPEIVIESPVLNKQDAFEVALTAKSMVLKGTANDKSLIESVKINDKDFAYDKNLNNVSFSHEVVISDLDKITVSVTDIYHNTNSVTYKIIRTEIDPPIIDIITPYTSDYAEIFLESETSTVFIEGKLIDQSLIKMVTVDGVEAKFLTENINPNFSATIDITGKDKINIKVVDIFGNTTDKVFKINRETARIMSSNPMGKTWVIFIDNSVYESFANLEGPSKDITTMKAALSKYDIHNIIEKKNMSKAQMEKFFAIELRDMVKNQKVNSLLVWYAGHGKFINETGYWIPTDAKRDEEFTYFNVNSLKAFMQSYTTFVTHVLVITDACESGPSFYAAMRGAKKRECGDSTPTILKSSQVFSSAGYELAADNSPFTKTFAKSLDYNINSCIPIDNIVITVTESIGQGSKQSPKFGKIQGLEDEDGTFFFVKKTR